MTDVVDGRLANAKSSMFQENNPDAACMYVHTCFDTRYVICMKEKAQHGAEQHGTTRHSTAPHGRARHHKALHCAPLRCCAVRVPLLSADVHDHEQGGLRW